jgi:hypothetical protein
MAMAKKASQQFGADESFQYGIRQRRRIGHAFQHDSVEIGKRAFPNNSTGWTMIILSCTDLSCAFVNTSNVGMMKKESGS